MSTAEILLLTRLALSAIGLVACGLTLVATAKYYVDLKSLMLTPEEQDEFHVRLNGTKEIMAISRVIAMTLLFVIHCAFIFINVFVWNSGVSYPSSPISVAWIIAQVSAALMALNNYWTMHVIFALVHEKQD